MRRRSALIGFTEAELGFVVAAVVAFAAAQEVAPAPPVPPPAARDSQPAAARPDSAKAPADSISREHTRNCSAVRGAGLPRVPVPPIRIEAPQRYRVGGRSYSLAELNRFLQPHEHVAAANRCRFTLVFETPDSVSHNVATRSEKPFGGRFYLRNQ